MGHHAPSSFSAIQKLTWPGHLPINTPRPQFNLRSGFSKSSCWREAEQLNLAEDTLSTLATSKPRKSLGYRNLTGIYTLQGRTAESGQLLY
jgi:hypothetical protein